MDRFWDNRIMGDLTFPINTHVVAACSDSELPLLTLEYHMEKVKNNPIFEDLNDALKSAIKSVREFVFDKIENMLAARGNTLDVIGPDEFYARMHGLVSDAERRDWEKFTKSKAIPYQ